jgi:hypothetical protein
MLLRFVEVTREVYGGIDEATIREMAHIVLGVEPH